jgi:hypothetical protein
MIATPRVLKLGLLRQCMDLRRTKRGVYQDVEEVRDTRIARSRIGYDSRD